MTQELSQFNELKASIQDLVSPAFTVEVTDFQSSQVAIDAAKRIKAYTKEVETKRKELVSPLNDRVKQINDYAKDIAAPLIQAEQFIKQQLEAFEEKQEKIRQAEIARAEAERVAAERAAEELRAAEEQATLDRMAAESEAQDEVGESFGFGGPAEDQATRNARHEAEWNAEQERLAAEEALRAAEHKKRIWDIEQQKVKNVAKVWKCEAEDLAKVPREFLIIQLNDKAVLAAARGGVTQIPGVRLWQESSARIGARTYVPKSVLSG